MNTLHRICTTLLLGAALVASLSACTPEEVAFWVAFDDARHTETPVEPERSITVDAQCETFNVEVHGYAAADLIGFGYGMLPHGNYGIEGSYSMPVYSWDRTGDGYTWIASVNGVSVQGGTISSCPLAQS